MVERAPRVRAVGWDWVGANLDDGSALMVFRIRNAAGEPLWASATIRARGASRAPCRPKR
jgi:predicted secreted hydrolase